MAQFEEKGLYTEKTCIRYLSNVSKLNYTGEGLGCNGVFDGISCWEATPANTTLRLPCPSIRGLFDDSKFLYKHCLDTGFWEGHVKRNSYAGYTEYKVCLTEETLRETERVERNKNTELIYRVVSYVELAGIALSILCLLVSLFIFAYHKSLRCKRTKIHLNLFVAILLTSVLRLVFFVDRLVFKMLNQEDSTLAYESQLNQINKIICPIMTTFLEYAQLCNFMWMCNEGIYLNILLQYAMFNNNHRTIQIILYCIGWGLPFIISLTWALTVYHTNGIDDICWLGYYDRKTYWIIKGPVFASLIIGILCLINVIRILAKKLRQNHPSEIDQIKKSAKAAILLLPLLGATHIFEVYYGEPENWIVNLALSIVKAVLVFFQGVFLSIIYCFMNNEVKNKLKRHWLNKFSFKSMFGRDRTKKRTCDRSRGSLSPSRKEAQKLVDSVKTERTDLDTKLKCSQV